MAVAEVRQPALRSDVDTRTVAEKLSRLPLHLLLVFIALLWILPAMGLFVTSLLPPSVANAEGWWNVFSKPSELTFANYSNMLNNSDIMHALWVTFLVTLGATILPILIASLAAYALAWVEFPGRDLMFVGVIGLMVVPL